MKTRISDKTRIRRGLGVGEKEAYSSFIKPRDFSSNSRVHRLMGHIIKRMFVLLSDLERSFFYYFDFCDNIKDIREQYPLLPLEHTKMIATECQIKHPQNEKGDDVVMTTDLLITIQHDGREELIAISIKPSAKLNKRTIEKMQIEKKYWNDQDVKWIVLTEKQINKIQNNNINFLRDFFNKESIEHDYSNLILNSLKEQVENKDTVVRDFIASMARNLRITDGEARRSFYHLLATKRVRFDYTKSFNFNFKLAELNITQHEEK